MSTIYTALQNQVVKARMAAAVRDFVPVGFVEAMDSSVDRAEESLVSAYSSLNEHANVLFMAGFNAELRALTRSNDASIASLAKSLYDILKKSDTSQPVVIRTEGGESITREDPGYVDCAVNALSDDINQFAQMMEQAQPSMTIEEADSVEVLNEEQPTEPEKVDHQDQDQEQEVSEKEAEEK